MNADELDAAREAVSATRTWRNQMRADWGTSFREPEEVLDEAVGELTAERDRLMEELRWTENTLDNVRMGMAEASAERGRLRAVVDAMPVLVERTVRALQQTVGRDLAVDPDTIRDGITATLAAIRAGDQLDGSPTIGGDSDG